MIYAKLTREGDIKKHSCWNVVREKYDSEDAVQAEVKAHHGEVKKICGVCERVFYIPSTGNTKKKDVICETCRTPNMSIQSQYAHIRSLA